jgi:serine/threonine protein kinase
VDIRSDLYSLGVTLWVMVTGQIPFRGIPGEVMHQHQHAPLPLERLKDVPQPVVVLLEKLLEKDPAQRFRTPNELLKVIPTITGAIDSRRRITRQSLQKTPYPGSRVGTRKPPRRLAPKKISIARLPVTGSAISMAESAFHPLDIVNGALMTHGKLQRTQVLIRHWIFMRLLFLGAYVPRSGQQRAKVCGDAQIVAERSP